MPPSEGENWRVRERALKVRWHCRRQAPSSASMLSALSPSSDRCCTPWEELERAVRKMAAEDNSVLAEERCEHGGTGWRGDERE
jgi:hypothetical protein